MIKEAHVPLIKRSAHLANDIYSTVDDELLRDEASDAEARVFFDDEATYIVFRGSESRTDWVINIMFRFRVASFVTNNDDVCAHSGFVYQWKGVRKQIVHVLKEKHDQSKPIVVCGHSLGGAVATIAAVELQNTGFHCILITFGSPRALNWYGMQKFKQDNITGYRITNGADVVTMVPVVMLHHVGMPIECHRKPWWYLVSIIDHSMETYAQWGRDL